MDEFFDQAYLDGTARWDIGRPQGEVVALAEDGEFEGRVLDVGCGTGEHALYLSERGYDVLGVDGAEAAIALASQKARDRRLRAGFRVWDALDLAALEESFDTVLDVGLFHTFDTGERSAYVAGLSAVVAPGGRFFVMCFSENEPGDYGPYRVTQAQIREAFAQGWRIEWVRTAVFDTRRGGGRAQAWLAKIRT